MRGLLLMGLILIAAIVGAVVLSRVWYVRTHPKPSVQHRNCILTAGGLKCSEGHLSPSLTSAS